MLNSCGNSKKVLICGDHECINKDEAQLYFQENLSLEIRIIDKNNKTKSYDLVQLNTSENDQNKRSIFIEKDAPLKKSSPLKTLSKLEVEEKKKEIESKKRLAKIDQKKNKIIKKDNKKLSKNEIIPKNKQKKRTKTKSNDSESTSRIETVYKNDICLILEKCNIDEISKYLIKRGNKKGYPDITISE